MSQHHHQVRQQQQQQQQHAAAAMMATNAMQPQHSAMHYSAQQHGLNDTPASITDHGLQPVNIPQLAEFASSMVFLMWHARRPSVLALYNSPTSTTSPVGTPPSNASPTGAGASASSQHRQTISIGSSASPAFKKFCLQVLTATQLSESVVVLSLKYIAMLLQNNPNIQGAEGSEYRLFTVALMLANKFLDDNTFTNKTWSEVTNMKIVDLNIMELEFLDVLRFRLFVKQEEYERWKAALFKFRNQLSTVNDTEAQQQRQQQAQVIEATLRSMGLTSPQQDQHAWAAQQQQQEVARRQAQAQAVQQQQQQQQQQQAVAAQQQYQMYLLSKGQQPQFPLHPPSRPVHRVPLRLPVHPVYIPPPTVHTAQVLHSTSPAQQAIMNSYYDNAVAAANAHQQATSAALVQQQQQQQQPPPMSSASAAPVASIGSSRTPQPTNVHYDTAQQHPAHHQPVQPPQQGRTTPLSATSGGGAFEYPPPHSSSMGQARSDSMVYGQYSGYPGQSAPASIGHSNSQPNYAPPPPSANSHPVPAGGSSGYSQQQQQQQAAIQRSSSLPQGATSIGSAVASQGYPAISSSQNSQSLYHYPTPNATPSMPTNVRVAEGNVQPHPYGPSANQNPGYSSAPAHVSSQGRNYYGSDNSRPPPQEYAYNSQPNAQLDPRVPAYQGRSPMIRTPSTPGYAYEGDAYHQDEYGERRDHNSLSANANAFHPRQPTYYPQQQQQQQPQYSARPPANSGPQPEDPRTAALQYRSQSGPQPEDPRTAVDSYRSKR